MINYKCKIKTCKASIPISQVTFRSVDGQFKSAAYADWFVFKDLSKPGTTRIIAYCPLHSAPAIQWRKNYLRWLDSYWRRYWVPMVMKIMPAFIFNFLVKNNPAPQPPW